MFVALKNGKVLHHLENPLLCEALARGFADVAALRAWEAGLPRNEKGKPAKPALKDIRVLELSPEQSLRMAQLREDGFLRDEIRIIESEGGDFTLAGDDESRSRRLDNKLWNTVREKRNELLQASDKYILPDFPLPTGKRELWMSYRQALRDITRSAKDPLTVQWPSPP